MDDVFPPSIIPSQHHQFRHMYHDIQLQVTRADENGPLIESYYKFTMCYGPVSQNYLMV